MEYYVTIRTNGLINYQQEMCGLFLANPGEAGVNSFTPQYAYSPYCSLYISYCAGKENLFNNQEFLQLIIISFVIVT